MSWRDTLQTAHFRGVPFGVQEAHGSGGRRIKTHEYPQRDQPFSEDLGRKARETKLIGYVVGTNYHTDRNRLIRALEQNGPGILNHPLRGELNVVVKSYTVKESKDTGGMAEFNMTFIERGSQNSIQDSIQNIIRESITDGSINTERAVNEIATRTTQTIIERAVAEVSISNQPDSVKGIVTNTIRQIGRTIQQQAKSTT